MKRLLGFYLLTDADRNRKPESTLTSPQKSPFRLSSHHICFCFAARPAPNPACTVIHVYFTVTGIPLQRRNQSVSTRLDVKSNVWRGDGCLAMGGSCYNGQMFWMCQLNNVVASLSLSFFLSSADDSSSRLGSGTVSTDSAQAPDLAGKLGNDSPNSSDALKHIQAQQISQIKMFHLMGSLCDVIRGSSTHRFSYFFLFLLLWNLWRKASELFSSNTCWRDCKHRVNSAVSTLQLPLENLFGQFNIKDETNYFFIKLLHRNIFFYLYIFYYIFQAVPCSKFAD